ncbi:MAG: autotransporter domain-containing protein [Planctomycetes bacterium]|nr:autotransporter domain-containing protein [Planctomycetota bacterium]
MIVVPAVLYGGTFQVTNLDDLGAGSLRQAITDANNNAGNDIISFDAALSGDLNLSSLLPVFSDTGTDTTFENAGDINLIYDAGSAGGDATQFYTLKFGNNVTVTGDLPGSVSFTTTGDYASVISTETSGTQRSIILTNGLSGTVTGSFGSGGWGLIGVDGIRLDSALAGTVNITTTENTAKGLCTLNGDLTINGDLSGNVTATAGTNAAYGLQVDDDLTINGDLSGSVTAEAKTADTAYGLSASDLSVTGVLSGTVTAKAATSAAYGLSAGQDLTVGGELSGTVLAEAGTNTAYGMKSNDNLEITGKLSGSVTATTGTDDAYGLKAGDNLTVNGDLSGSVTATAGTDTAVGLLSIDNMILGAGISGSVTATAGSHTAKGLSSLGTLDNGAGGAADITGSVTADAAGLAVAVGVKEGMKINVTGTLSATDTAGTEKAYAVAAGQSDGSGSWVAGGNYNDTVVFGNGAAITGQVALGGGTNDLTLDGGGTLAGAVSNITNMSKTGAGTWTTTGRIDTDNLSVNAGTLSVDADTGHVVDGNMTVEVGSTVTAAIRQNGAATFSVANTATNNGEIQFEMKTFAPAGTAFTVLSSGGLAGAGTYTVDNSFLTVAANGNNIEITKQAYADRSLNSANAKAMAVALDTESTSATGSMADLLTELDQASTLTEFNDCLDELVADQNFSAVGMDTARLFALAAQTRMAGIRFNRSAVAGRSNRQDFLDPDDPSTWPLVAYTGDITELIDQRPVDSDRPNAVYLQTLGKSGSLNSHDGYDGYDYETTGLTGGWDRMLGKEFLAGINFGYAKNKVDYLDTGNSNADVESFNTGLYGTWFRQNWYLEATLSGAYNKSGANRNITFLGSTAKSNAEGYTLSGKLDYSYRFAFGETGLSPRISTEYMHFYQDNYTETGAGAANLSVDSLTNKSLQTGLGIKLDHRWRISQATIIPEISAMWMHEFLNRDRQYNVTMSGAPGTVFSQTMAAAEKNSFRFCAGITAIHVYGLSLSVQYQGEVEKHAKSHSLSGELLWLF